MSKKLVIHKGDAEEYSLLVASQGHSQDRIIQSSYKNLVPSRGKFTDKDLIKPSDDQIKESTILTQQLLNKIVESKLSLSHLKSSSASVTKRGDATYIRYKSNKILNNGEPMERIIKIVDKQIDPMMPVKFAIRNLPQGPPSPPAPVMHEPSAKLTLQDHKDWYIPPAISNWKNQKGFTILLDKRMLYLENDHIPQEINDNFSKLSNAMEQAETDARENLKLKNELRLKLEQQENLQKELKLKELSRKQYDDSGRKFSNDYHSARQREISRQERRLKAEREIKLSKLSKEQKLRNDDVSERVINGIMKSNDTEFDTRVSNRLKDQEQDEEEELNIGSPIVFERDEPVHKKPKH